MIAALSLEQTKFWFDILQTALIFAFWLHTWLNNRQRVTEVSLRHLEIDLKGTMNDHAERITRQEQNFKYAPTHEDFKRVHERLDKVNNELSVLRGEFSEVKRTLSLIHEVMMDKG